MSMSRADYRRIADTIHNLSFGRYGDEARAQRTYVAAAIATALTPTNPLFDRQRFIAACVDGAALPLEAPVALTEAQSDMFNAVTAGARNIILISSLYDGEPVSVIAAVTREEGCDEVTVSPLYIEAIPAMFDRLADPAADLEEAVPA